MPPKRATKRKSNETTANATDPGTWPGWVEIESDPLLFTTLLKDMGVRGIGVHDMESGLDDFSLLALPNPIHAFIFLFRYAETEKTDASPTSCPDHVWFANQVPDFACATFALLNIVNNIPELELGRELQRFKDFTKDMDPLSRGDAVDSFDFVRRIHNSFAREKDILEADLCIKNKADKHKKRKAAEKASKTKAAKKAAQASGKPLKQISANAGARTSGRKQLAAKKKQLANGTEGGASDDDFAPSKSKTTRKTGQSNGKSTRSKSSLGSSPTILDSEEITGDLAVTKSAPIPDGVRKSGRQPTNKSIKDESEPEEPRDDDLEAAIKASLGDPQVNGKPQTRGVRRSARPPKPRKDHYSAVLQEAEEAGFHFVAYMPINGHVWMLDGMDRFPTDVGSYTDGRNGGDWLRVAMPALRQRMAATDDIRATLLAVTHDDLFTSRRDLLSNIKAVRKTQEKLADIMDCWREMDGGETPKGAVTGASGELGIKQEDIDSADLDADIGVSIERADGDMLKLIKLRNELLSAQPMLRGSVRDLSAKEQEMDEQGARRKHDYGRFVRGWVEALAEQGVLSELVEGAEAEG